MPPPNRLSVRLHTADEIGTAVREARRQRGLSQGALADLIGASRQWVQRLEAGTPGVELGLTLRALTGLGLSLDIGALIGDALGAPALPTASWLTQTKRKPDSRTPAPGEVTPRVGAPRPSRARREPPRRVEIPGWHDAPTLVDAPDATQMRPRRAPLQLP